MNVRFSGAPAGCDPTNENLALQRLTRKPVSRGPLLIRTIHQLVFLSSGQGIPRAGGGRAVTSFGSPWQRRHEL